MDPLAELVGESPPIEAMRDQIRRLLVRRETGRRLPAILINGETGSGKGLVAQTIHRAGPRAGGPFVDVNCAAIPETLLEAELFGFERGAFTDARHSKPGLFQAAHRGTIFLDEVGLLPEPLQAKLLKVLEEQAVRRLGATAPEPIDVWIISATNADLQAAVRQKSFREDLYHRLAVLTLRLPALRERGNDVLILAERFLARACADYGLSPKRLTPDAEARLLAYPWPGNVRELGNVMERVALLAESEVVTGDMLELEAAAVAGPLAAPAAAAPAAVSLDDAMRDHLVTVLTQTGWNITRTAALLDISRNTLRARIDKLGLRSGRGPAAPSARASRGERKAPVPAATPAVPAGPVPIRWEQRRVAFLRVTLVKPEDDPLLLSATRVLDTLIQKVESFGGRLVDIAATGITAAFGLEPAEDAPRRAALAATAMRKAALRDEGGEGARATMRAAIHVERVPFVRVGGVTDIDGDAKRHVGSVLDALLVSAGPGAIVVSQSTMPLLARLFALAETGAPEHPSGRVYSLTDYRRTPFDLGGRMARFVGRDQELHLLRSRLNAAREGQGQIVSLIGEAGIGKSRLLFEFRESLAAQPITYLEGRCLSYGSAIPYIPVLELLRAVCRIVDFDSPDIVTEKVRIALGGAGIDPLEAAPVLTQLLGIKSPADGLATLSPEAIKARTFETLNALLLNNTQSAPLIIAIEDLQWVDQTSEEYLASLADRVVGERLLLVATYRPGYQPPWINKSFATQMALQPLAHEESLTVVRGTFGTDEVAGPLAQSILAKAEGNPFFLEELARAAREQWPESTILTAPDTVQEVLLARIDRLPPAEAHLLQAAAVIGKDFAFEVLRAIADGPDDAVREGLRHLQGAEFIHETGAIPHATYTFRHALTHEVAYEHLLGEPRRALHAKILGAIETLYVDRLAEHVERLAHHAFLGEVWGKAVTYLRLAGNNAAARSANREAFGRFEQALAALEHLPSGRDTAEQAIDIRFELRNPLHLLAEFGRLFDHLREAQALAEAIDDQSRLGWVFSYLTQTLRLTGNADQAIQCGQRAIDIAEHRGDFALQVATEFHLGSAYEDLGDYRRASATLGRVVERLQGARVYERFGLSGLPSLVARAHLVCCLAELGDFTKAFDRGQEGIRIAEEVYDPHGLVNAQFGVATVSILKGEFLEAVPLLERGLGLCRSSNLLLMFPRLAAALGFAYAQSGRLAEAVPLLEQAVEQATSLRLANMHSTFLAWLGESRLMSGRIEDATRLTERAVECSRNQKERGHEAHALRLLGDLAVRGESPDVARGEDCYRRALALAHELGMRPLLGRCHLALGGLHRQAGRRQSAEEHLQLALGLFREMDMRRWLEQAEGELRQFN